MAECVVSSTVASLGDLLTHEAKFLSGVEGQVKSLQAELRQMQGFLNDADAREHKDDTLRLLLAEIRDAAYDAEDVVETYALKSESKRTGGATNALKRLTGIYTHVHGVGSEIEAVTSRISELTQRLHSNGVRVSSQGEGSSSLYARQRRSYPRIIEDIVVGINKNVVKLVVENRNKILLTSGGKGEAFWVRAKGKIIPRLLSPEMSWELLLKIARSGRDNADFNIDTRMKELGKRMVYFCGGRPLDIALLGGILATKYSSNEWKMVQDNIESYWRKREVEDRMDEPFSSDMITLSYVDLPTWLELCFLYLSQFPEGYELNVHKLIQLWIVEGCVQLPPDTGDEEMLEDVAECYLKELILRRIVLVGVGERDASSEIKTFYLHPLMRDMCLSKAGDDASSRRLAIHMHGRSCQFPLDYITSPNLRSLLCFYDYDFSDERWRLQNPIFDKLKLLRVLDLEGVDVSEGNLLKDVGELIYLRFLSLRHARVSKIPSSIGNLRWLQTLDLLIEGTILDVPNVIWKMERLRHLYLPEFCDAKTKLRLDNLKNLRTLVNFPAQNCDVRDLFSMTNLRELTIRDPMSIKNFTKFSKSLGIKLKCLRALSLDNNYEEDDREATKFKDLQSMSFGDFTVPSI